MKRLNVILLFIAGPILLCSTAWVNITLTRPALITLPPEIHNIAVLDRTLQDNTRSNKIEQTITGEAFHQDEQAVREVQRGIMERCGEYGKFTFIKINERTKSDFTKNTFPTVLSWGDVEKICRKSGADALLAIEIFDSDFLLTPGIHANPTGNVLNSVRVGANGVAVINLGIRVYYPATRTILDEYKIEHRINFNGNATTVAGVANAILDKTEAVNRTSYESGRLYGDRISPSFYTVRREFFNKPKHNRYLSEGVRKSEVADWKGAIDSWTKALDDKKKKVRRRAAYNIAVGYEVLGDLEKAKDWASKAFTEYREKSAKPYYDALVYRQNQAAAVREQNNK